MAILNNNDKPIGSKGSTTYRRRGDVIIASVKVDKRPDRPLTGPQIEWDVMWSNGIQLWKAFRGELKEGFEVEKPTQTQFNMFIKYYMEKPAVALTKQQSEAGTQVLDHVYVSHGSLNPEVGVTQQSDSLVVTDICLGDLKIGEDTTVGDFSLAVLRNNPMLGEGGVAPEQEARFQAGDQIMYYRGLQTPGTDVAPAKVKVALRRVQLNVGQTSLKLWDVTGSNGFTSHLVGGKYYLSSLQEPYILSAYVQCRNVDKYSTLFTTQRMLGVNPELEKYTSAKALAAAIGSYGPVKPVDQFDPRTAPNATTGNQGGTGGQGGNQGNPDPTQVELTFAVNNSAWGTVTPESGLYTVGSTIQAVATPKSGCEFTGWSDSVSTATRTITVPATAQTYTANFRTGGGLGVWLEQHPDATPEEIAEEMKRLKEAGEL